METTSTVAAEPGATVNVFKFRTRRTSGPSARPLPRRMGTSQVRLKEVTHQRDKLVATFEETETSRTVEMSWTDPLSLLADIAELSLAAERAFSKAPFA